MIPYPDAMTAGSASLFQRTSHMAMTVKAQVNASLAVHLDSLTEVNTSHLRCQCRSSEWRYTQAEG